MRQVKNIIAPAADARQLRQCAGHGKRHSDDRPSDASRQPVTPVFQSERPITETRSQYYTPASAQLIGEAGENLVLSRLQSCGIAAQSAMPSLPYDLIADVPGFDMVRIQVKTRSRPTEGRCSFTMQRGFYRSKAGIFPYTPDDFDIAAFVCLSLNAVFFRAFPVKRFSVPTSLLRLPEIDRDTLELAIETMKRRRLQDRLACLAALPSDAVTIAASSSSGSSSAANATCEQAEFDFQFRS